jgi:hypothetical protein
VPLIDQSITIFAQSLNDNQPEGKRHDGDRTIPRQFLGIRIVSNPAAIIPQPLPRPIRPLSLLPLGVMVNDPVGRKDMK